MLETKINFQNGVTFVLVKLDIKYKVQLVFETTYLTTLLNCNILLRT